MIRGFMIGFFLLRILDSNGQQPVKDYVQQHAVAVSTIDPAAKDDADLEAIAAAIGNARIVMLGEQDHGDGPTYLAKTRLIKFLHEKKGFNVLAFESDFFALNTGWDRLEKSETAIDSFLKWNVFAYWTRCHTCSNLFYQYIPATFKSGNPITITGIDNQLVLEYSRNQMTRQLDSVWKAENISITKLANYTSEIQPLLDANWKSYLKEQYDPVLLQKAEGYWVTARKEMAGKLGDNNYWTVLTDNVYQFTRFLRLSGSKEGLNIRDQQMAHNLAWLAKVKFPDQKIIVWAANFHISGYGDPANSRKPVTMGKYLEQDSILSPQVYCIGFTSYDGTWARIGQQTATVEKPRKGESIEGWFNEAMEYSFIDFHQYNLQNPGSKKDFFLKGFGHKNYWQPWNRVFDGVFFIRHMYPCQQVNL